VSYQGRSFKQDLAVILWSAGTAGLLLLPGGIFGTLGLEPLWLRFAESAVHGGLFFVMAVLLGRAFLVREASAVAATMAICLVYAILLELLQIPVPGRSFEVIDIVAAAVGILAAVGMTRIFSGSLQPRGAGVAIH